LSNPYKLILSDQDGTIAIEWGAYGVPETFLVYERKIIKKIIGPINNNSLLEIQKLIK
jgi:cytochrome c biogenesis protein CcmG/thiol:disulfide interchange protein DsbE